MLGLYLYLGKIRTIHLQFYLRYRRIGILG